MAKFKTYNQNQSYLLPPSLSDCLPKDHICFMINSMVDDLNLSSIERTYSNGGSSAYPPQALIKVLFLAYIQGAKSSRKIENKLREDIAFRFLSGNITPDHGTINLFRKNHLVNLKELFAEVVVMINNLGMINLKDISIDGTKIKANANRYNTLDLKKIKEIEDYFEKIMKESELIDKEEDEKYGNECGLDRMPADLVDPEKRKEAIKKAREEIDKLKKARKEIEEKQNNADSSQDKKLKKNSTTNKTDSDSNLMKMKEGSFKMAYNVQLVASKQLITAYDLNNDPTDYRSLIPLIQETETNNNVKVETVKADAGYFGKSNIEFLENNGIDSYIPIQNNNSKNKFVYDQSKNEFVCSQGKRLIFKRKKGDISYYQGIECENCANRLNCTKNKKKSFQYDFKLKEMASKMQEKLKTPQGKKKYAERTPEIEPIFANMKYNQGFNYFLQRGKPRVLIELGLHCVAHNLVKIYKHLQKIEKSIKEALETTTKIPQLNS